MFVLTHENRLIFLGQLISLSNFCLVVYFTMLVNYWSIAL